MSKVSCPQCSHEIQPDQVDCPSCSTPIVATDLETLPRGLDPARSKPQAKPAARFAAGDVLATRYRLVQLLGRGGMGEVYLADDLTLEQPVALKLLPEGLERDARLLARLNEEVSFARRVTHPAVCRVFDIGEGDGLHFLSMEYIDGENLSSLLRRVGRLSEDRAIAVGIEICSGLAAAHAEGILHRDLKPGNLMVDGRGRVKVADFGLAHLSSPSSEGGPLMGTPAYMAPELFHGEPATVQSDLYALGLVLYQVLTGRRAYDDTAGARPSRDRPPPPRPSDLVETLPSALDDVVLACLASDPNDRPVSASVVGEALKTAGGGRATELKTLVYTDLGEVPASDRSGYGALVTRLVRDHEGRRLDAGANLRIVLDRPQDAVLFALEYHRGLRSLADGSGAWSAGVAIHLGELLTSSGDLSGSHRLRVAERSEAVATGLVRLAGAGQTLLSRGAFDLARQSEETQGSDLSWLAHGTYEVEGIHESLHVFEVGVDGTSPLSTPTDGPGFRRRLLQPAVAGWRPAVGLELPQRPHWIMERQIGEGGFGEVWLAVHHKTGEQRAFKFCYDEERLRALKREITLFRLLKENLGERDDITRIFDWNFEQSPFFIEAAYTAGGSLVDWVEAMGGSEQIPLETRLDIVAQVATALAAAHSVGVLHKDVKPANVLITVLDDGRVRAQLSDFGVGLLTEHQRLAEAGITALGMTELPDPGDSPSSDSGTRLYTAPELMEGKPASLQADVYALGVVLYQLVVGDFSRVLAPGWERDVGDELLREDIAATVDGSPEERLADARRLAERLDRLEERREELAAERRNEVEVQEAREALVQLKRRRKVVLVAVVGMVVAVFVAVVLSIQSRRIAERAEEAQQVSDFLVELFAEQDPYRRQGDPLTAREILDRGADRIEKSLAGQPGTQARLMQLLGTVYGRLGDYKRALALHEGALEIRRQLYGEEDHEEVIESMNSVAHALNQNRRFDDAEAMARKVLEQVRATGRPPGLAEATSSTVMAESLFSSGHYAEAEKFSKDALAIIRVERGEQHAEFAKGLQIRAACILAQGEPERAEPFYQQSLEIFQQIHGERHPQVAFALLHLGLLMVNKDAFVDAERYLRESHGMFQETLGEDHPLVNSSLQHLARIVRQQERWDEALALYETASLASYDEAGPTRVTARILGQMAELHQQQGNLLGSRDHRRRAVEIFRDVLGGDHDLLAQGLRDLARSQRMLGDHDQAESTYREALSMFERLHGAEHATVHRTMLDLAEVLLVENSLEQAEEMLREGLRRIDGGDDSDRRQLGRAQSLLGECLARRGEFLEAEQLLKAADASREAGGTTRSRDLGFQKENLKRLVQLYSSWGREDDARRYDEQLGRLSAASDS